MAVQTSGSFSGSVNSGYQKLIVKWSSVQHEDTGSSTITAEMWFKSAGAISIGSRSNSATIDGTTQSWSSSSVQKSSSFEIKLATVTQEVQHDQSTGKKTFSMSSVFNIQATLSGTYYSSITANSGNIELPTIARASTITVDPSNIGSATTIRITKANDNFSTSLYWRIKNGQSSAWNVIDNTPNSTFTWTPPASGEFNLYNSMTYTQKTITLEFMAITLNSSYTQVGDDKFTEQTFTAVGNPTVGTKTATDINSVTAQLSSGSNTSITKMVNGASNVKVEVTATALNGAGIKSVTVNGTSLSLNGSASTVTRSGNYTFNKTTSNTFTVVVVDSRDHTTTTTTNSLEKINYVPLTLNVTNLKRNNPTNGKIDISVSGNYWSGNFRTNVPNTLTVQYQFQPSGGSWSSWNNMSVTISSGSNTYSGSIQLSGMDYTQVYNFNFRAVDAVGTVPVSNKTVPKGQPVYWWDNNGLYVNGKFYTNDMGTNNTTDTWVPVWRNGYLEHRVIHSDLNNRGVKARNSVGDLGWGTNNNYLPDISMMAYWNGAYSGTNSNLTYCSGGTIAKTSQLPSSGVSGIWKYIKYDNGYALCIGSQKIDTAIGTSWGNIYSSGDKALDDFPSGLFIEVPYVSFSPKAYNANPGGGGYSCFVAGGNASTTTTNPGKILLLRGSKETSSHGYSVTIIAFGKWKN